ncbi:hypothetical protein VCHA50P415_20642 [Vibrio chagasii]|nr:hypothetical protein VCHA27O13_20050 [Vibrio chagasii]CAH6881698.1 hypothetical protein VCHA34P117_20162 [Vibrio chagasii]CAH6905885.1 hypothetical protein VCHA31O73_350020 [Vibrio chagasii]CAH6929925.1 hypothetical protein VCHA35O141_390055 [Vibrio chagasii]CAH6930396.1 hypothetical protein VCHA35O143_380054 [Vibrio chagasii]
MMWYLFIGGALLIISMLRKETTAAKGQTEWLKEVINLR